METVKKTEQLYEGKAKRVYATANPDYCIVSYKDDATAFNGLKKGTIAGFALYAWQSWVFQTPSDQCSLSVANPGSGVLFF